MTVREVILLGAMSSLPMISTAQTVRGTVVDGIEGGAVRGAVVLLMDNGGTIVRRALTDERGEFRVSAPGAGLYRVRMLRIGFLPATSPSFSLVSGQELALPQLVAGAPVSLDTVRVVGRNSCRLHGDSALATYALWEQVRTALTAAQLTTNIRSMSATVVVFERALDPYDGTVRRQAFWVRTGFTNRPWVSLSVDSLRRFGYVVHGADGWRTYHAPDLSVLLSSQFLEDHCFRLANGSKVSEVGLSFEPTADRSRLPEIKGMLWLDRKSAELRRMEFRYTRVSPVEQQSNTGGEMDFVRLSNGAWAISRWMIRMPALTQQFKASPMRGGVSGSEIIITEIKLAGGELAIIRNGRDTLWSRAPQVLRGVVLDSASGRFVGGARVSLKGIARQATTDSAGRFGIPEVLPGEYTLEVRVPGQDTVGPPHRSSLAFADSSVRVRVRVPLGDPVVRAELPTESHAVPRRPSTADPVMAASRPAIPEFEERRARYRGRFLTREDIEKKGGSRISDLLIGTVGLRIFATARGEGFATSGRGRVTVEGDNPECLAHIYVDGAMAYAGGNQPPFDLNSLSPDQLEAIEYYAGGGQIPQEFNRAGATCGVLILWTRRR
jgi:hypothetical protein